LARSITAGEDAETRACTPKIKPKNYSSAGVLAMHVHLVSNMTA
jgi:hypothetical protein